jgi:hypothetical protein
MRIGRVEVAASTRAAPEFRAPALTGIEALLERRVEHQIIDVEGNANLRGDRA